MVELCLGLVKDHGLVKMIMCIFLFIDNYVYTNTKHKLQRLQSHIFFF